MPTIIKVDAKEKKFTFDEQPWEDYGLKGKQSSQTTQMKRSGKDELINFFNPSPCNNDLLSCSEVMV